MMSYLHAERVCFSQILSQVSVASLQAQYHYRRQWQRKQTALKQRIYQNYSMVID